MSSSPIGTTDALNKISKKLDTIIKYLGKTNDYLEDIHLHTMSIENINSRLRNIEEHINVIASKKY